MKLSKETISVLKNFSTIQPNLVVEIGSTISTLADAKNIIAEAIVSEDFKQSFGIYNLTEFLSAFSLLQEPDLEFSHNSVTLNDGKAKVKYHFADPSILTKKSKDISMPNTNLTVLLTEESISNIRRAASALGQSVLSLVIEGDDCVARVLDPMNASANSYSIVVGNGYAEKYSGVSDAWDFQFLIENLKLITGNYTVHISDKLISKWEGNNINYYIALEKTSKV